MTRVKTWAVVGLMLVGGGKSAAAEEPQGLNELIEAALEGGSRSEQEAWIEHQLRSRVSVNFRDVPLRQVIADFGELSGCHVIPDLRGLREACVDLERPITFKARRLPLAMALQSILREVDMTFRVQDETIAVVMKPWRKGKVCSYLSSLHTPPGGDRLTTLTNNPGTTVAERLCVPVDVNFTDCPLSDALTKLHEMTGAALVADKSVLNEAAISLETPVTLRIENISARSVLNIITHTLGLRWVVKDEVIHVTTEAVARGPRLVRIYFVADLVMPISSGESELFPLFCPDDGETIQKPKPADSWEAALMRLIVKTIEPTSWSSAGGKGTIEYHPLGLALVVNQTSDVQEQIHDLLAAIRTWQRRASSN